MKAGNGILKGEYKVKGGKLIKCMIELQEGKIKEIKIHGDFFMYPEEAIEKLENGLKEIKFEEEEIKDAIEKALKGVELIGVSINDFVYAIMNSKRIQQI